MTPRQLVVPYCPLLNHWDFPSSLDCLPVPLVLVPRCVILLRV